MKIIFDYNRTIFDPETNMLYPGVFGLLKKLSVTHELFLISRNEPTKEKRFNEFEIEQYFKKVMFVSEKTLQIFAEMIGDTKEVIVIGDSISDEIKIGNLLGFNTVRLRKGRFAMQIPKSANEIAQFEILDITDLENIILNYEK